MKIFIDVVIVDEKIKKDGKEKTEKNTPLKATRPFFKTVLKDFI